MSGIRLARSGGLLSRRTASAVILRDVTGRGVTLQGTATMIWDLLHVPSSSDELITELRSRFSDQDGTLEDDVLRVLDQLRADGILEEIDDDG